MAPYTVLFLIDELDVWRGTETHLFRLLQALDPARIRPVVATLQRWRLAEEFRAEGIPFFPLKIKKVLGPPGVRGLGRIITLLRREGVRLVVSYHTGADLLAPLSARAVRVPVISCRRDMGFTKKPVHIALQTPLNRLLRGMISVSHAVAREVERVERYPLSLNQVIWNGEDMQRFSPGPSHLRQELGLDPKARLVTCVGGLTGIKDHPTLLAAFERATAGRDDCRLLLVGDGPDRAKLEALAAPLGRRVRFLGHRLDIPEVLRASDVYLQTSRSEGFSNAILQAMGTALPVVATRVGGNPELVTPECGLLAEAGDVEGLSAALARLLDDPGQRGALGRAGRLRAEQTGALETMTARYQDAFERAIEDRFPGPSSE